MRYKPSKPAGALSIIMGTVMLGFAITASSRGHKFPVGFLIFWCVMVVGVISLSARAAFFKNGSLAT